MVEVVAVVVGHISAQISVMVVHRVLMEAMTGIAGETHVARADAADMRAAAEASKVRAAKSTDMTAATEASDVAAATESTPHMATTTASAACFCCTCQQA